MPEELDWTEPTGGFLTRLTLPGELDTLAMRPAAIDAGVAYVPGPPFQVGGNGRNTLRLSFSHLTETKLETAVERLAGVVRGALEPANPSPPAAPLTPTPSERSPWGADHRAFARRGLGSTTPQQNAPSSPNDLR